MNFAFNRFGCHFSSGFAFLFYCGLWGSLSAQWTCFLNVALVKHLVCQPFSHPLSYPLGAQERSEQGQTSI